MKLIKRNYISIAYQPEELERYYPGPIDNAPILKDFNKYLREEDITDPTNLIVKRKTQEGTHYKLMPKECWDIIFKRFGGGPEIVRTKDNDMYSYSRKFNIKLNKVRACFFLYINFRFQF